VQAHGPHPAGVLHVVEGVGLRAPEEQLEFVQRHDELDRGVGGARKEARFR
jgi:hypothetical protein